METYGDGGSTVTDFESRPCGCCTSYILLTTVLDAFAPLHPRAHCLKTTTPKLQGLATKTYNEI